eukprot:5258629-Karenia_brevis.AAC.1
MVADARQEAADLAAARAQSMASSAPMPAMSSTQPTSSGPSTAYLSDLAFSQATGAPLPPTRLCPSVA